MPPKVTYPFKRLTIKSKPPPKARPPPPPEMLGKPMPKNLPPPPELLGKPHVWPKKPPPMTDAESKKRRAEIDRLLTKIYYDVDAGFGSIEDVLRRARQTDKGITREIVKEFLDRQAIRQRKAPTKSNSFIPREPLHEIQIDLADFVGFGESQYRYGLIAVDVFTKELTVVPMKGKSSEEASKGLDTVLKKLGIPQIVMVDEGGEFQAAFKERLKYYDVELKVTRTPPVFVERSIRTIKEGIKNRQEALGGKDWSAYLPGVLKKYAGSKHATTKMKPEDARKPENEEDVEANIKGKAKFERPYEPLEVGVLVKVRRKPGKFGEFKFDFNAWGESVHTVEEIIKGGEQDKYKVSGFARPLMRHELKWVGGAEKPTLARTRAKEKRGAQYATKAKLG